MIQINGDITAAEYREIKGRYEPEIRQLQQNMADIGQLSQKLNSHITAAADLLRNLRLYYTSAALPVKQKLIGSMFPEKLVFEKNNYRTIKLHPALALICRPSAGSSEKRKGLASKKRSQPYRVSLLAQISNQDVELIAELSRIRQMIGDISGQQ